MRNEHESRQHTTCCIVSGGPGGVTLDLLLARQGIEVTLLEKHADFQHDFRVDTIHPSTLEILDALGLADRLLQLPHTKLARMEATTPTGTFTCADLGMLKTTYPYLVTMPQSVSNRDIILNSARVKLPSWG